MTEFKHLRVEEEPPKNEGPRVVHAGQATIRAVPKTASDAPIRAPKTQTDDVEYWRSLAVKNGERLALAEAQARDLRTAADEARSRFTKYKNRLDAANARVNELQVDLTKVSVDRDDIRARLARQDFIRRKVYEYRQSIIDGPIWDVFSELCNDGSATAGEEKAKS